MKNTIWKRILSLALTLALIISYLPILSTNAADSAPSAVADPGTAHTWESMMGTALDGNRYAGRVWADKSVYTDGQTATLNTSGSAGSSFAVSLEDDEAFQVIFSVLGSSMTTTTTTSSTGPMDVVIVLDNSASMAQSSDNNSSDSVSRLQRVVEAANSLIADLLTIQNVRLAIVTYNTNSQTILTLDSYSNGVTLKANSYSQGGMGGRPGSGGSSTTGGVLTAYDDDNAALGSSSTGYQTGTNLQSGIDTGMKILANATNVTGRTPVMIVLTDGRADTAVNSSWYDTASGSYLQPASNDVTSGVALSTLLNAAYMKAKVEDVYGKTPNVYGIGVDLSRGDEAVAIINPADSSYGFNSSNTNTDIRNAYTYYTQWASGQTVSFTQSSSGGGGRPNGGGGSSTTWTFNHGYSGVTIDDITGHINYVDTYYDVYSTNLENAFDQIYAELSSGVFNPITSSTTTDGATGVEHTPLFYVDNIGKYMEIKEIQSVTLFGASYGVTKNADGSYTVQESTGTNPTTNENYNTSEDIIITVTENADGTQRLEVEIRQEILPILLEKVVDKTVGGVHSATINELSYNPLRVYYTVGLASDVLLPNGELDITKISSEYPYVNSEAGEVTFYSNIFGTMNTADSSDSDTLVDLGDAHVGFNPSNENRYYYHQSNQGIFTKITSKADGAEVTIPENAEYGLLWDEDAYSLNWMTYDEYLAAEDTDKVYTYVTYYRPTANTTDVATNAEKVTYLVYTDWQYLKVSVAFFDATSGKYVNYDAATGTYSLDDEGHVVSAADIAAYVTANPTAELYAVLGVGSLRTSRLHNMETAKTANTTQTASLRYAPQYTHEAPTIEHDHNVDVVVWLGNNGRLTTPVDTGIALTKAVTETIGSADDTYALTVTVPSGVTATPVVRDEDGNDITASTTYEDNTLTVNVKAGETVYISGIPAGTQCTIGETIPGDADYYISSQTATVTVPTLAQVLDGAAQFAPATVTNAPNKYGSLYITKELTSDHTIPEAILNTGFDVTVSLGSDLANKTFSVEDSAVSNPYTVTTDASGNITLKIKPRQTIHILGLPEGTEATITEVLTEAQAKIFSAAYRTRNHSGETADTDNAVTIPADANATAVITNTYTPLKTTVDLDVHGTKNFTVEPGITLPAGTFNFEVQKWTGTAWETVKTTSVSYTEGETTSSKTFQMEDVLAGIEYTTVGSWAYQVVEVKGDVANVTYDRTLYTFTVTVTDNGGQLVATVTDLHNAQIGNTTGDSALDYLVTFENTYHTAVVSIDIVKDVINNSGDPAVSKAGFEFKATRMTDKNFSTVWTDDSGDPSTYTVFSDAAGEARLTATYTTAGTYYYVVTEETPAGKGWVNSAAKYLVTVTVTESDGDLTASMQITTSGTPTDGETSSVADGNKGSVVFVNKYSPLPAVVDLNLAVKKSLTGKDSNAGFNFIVYKNGDPTQRILPGISKADGSVDFDGMLGPFEKVGKYEYDIVEVNDGAAGMTYDSTIYDLVVEVENDLANGKLVATYYFEDSTETTVTFHNSYVPTPTQYTLGGTKVLHGRAPGAGEFSFELWEGSTRIETVTNKADGTFEFTPISYTTAGEYTYTIREVEPEASKKSPGVAYDGASKPITVKVTVTDTNAVLSAAADIQNAAIEFENTYTAAPAYVTFRGTKKLISTEQELQDNTFTFKLYETDHTFNIETGTLLGTKQNVGGEFTFDNVSLTKAENRFFAIVEDATVDPIENVVYDSTQHNFHVQVRDAGLGQLTATVTYLNTGETSEPMVNAGAVVNFRNATFEKAAEKQVFSSTGETNIDGTLVQAGEILSYAITYRNYTGKDVVVDIMDTIPEHTSYVEGSASHEGTYVGTHVNWVLNVPRGEEVTVSFQVKVDETDVIVTNTAYVRDGVNTYATNEVVNHTIDDPAKKDVFLETDDTSIDGKKVYAQEVLTYVITYTNTSGAVADVTITDTIPAHTSYVENSAGAGSVYEDRKITWTIEDVQPWSTVSVSFQVKVDAEPGDSTIANKATVSDGTNTYDTNEVTNFTEKDPVSVTISGKKVLTGKELKDGDFTFGLYDAVLRADDTVKIYDLIDTAKNEGGTFTFQVTYSSLSDSGYTHLYVVKEIMPEGVDSTNTLDGITYDDTAYVVVVEVIENDDRTLRVLGPLWGPIDEDGVPSEEPVDEIIITNVYTPEEPEETVPEETEPEETEPEETEPEETEPEETEPEETEPEETEPEETEPEETEPEETEPEDDDPDKDDTDKDDTDKDDTDKDDSDKDDSDKDDSDKDDSDKDDSEDQDTIKTGDDSRLALWIAMLTASTLALAAILLSGRKKENA